MSAPPVKPTRPVKVVTPGHLSPRVSLITWHGSYSVSFLQHRSVPGVPRHQSRCGLKLAARDAWAPPHQAPVSPCARNPLSSRWKGLSLQLVTSRAGVIFQSSLKHWPLPPTQVPTWGISTQKFGEGKLASRPLPGQSVQTLAWWLDVSEVPQEKTIEFHTRNRAQKSFNPSLYLYRRGLKPQRLKPKIHTHFLTGLLTSPCGLVNTFPSAWVPKLQCGIPGSLAYK